MKNPPPSGMMGIRHVALNVMDVRRAVDFYTQIMGMRIEWEPDPDNVYLTSGADNLALHRAREASGLSPDRVDHIGFVVRSPADVDAWAAHLKANSIVLLQEPKTHRDGARSIYFKDPDGLQIQLIYHPPISDPA